MNLKSLTRNQLFQTLAYYLGFIGLGLVMVSSGPHMQNLLEHTNSTMDAFSMVLILSSVGFLIGSFSGGLLFDRFPGHFIFAACFALMGVTMAVMPLISKLWVMAGVMMLNGLALSLVDMGTNTLLTWVHGEKGAPYMNALHLFFGAGAALSPILAGKIITTTGDIYWSYWALALITVPLVILFLFVKSPMIRKKEEISQDQNVNQVANKRARTLLIALLFVYFMFYVAGEANFGKFITSYVQKSNFTVDQQVPYTINSIFWIAFTLGRVIAIPLTALWKNRRIVTIDYGLCILAFVIILAFPNSIVALGIGSALVGLGMASIFPTMFTYAEQSLRLTARISSLFYVGISGGNMFFSWLIARLFDDQGPFSFMIILSSLICIQVILWVVIAKVTMKSEAV